MSARVGVVVVTYNGWAYTRACLESLRHCITPHTVVLVDNGSRDETVANVAREFPEVRLLPQDTNLGYAGGNNVGIRWCLEQDLDPVVLLNNDTEIEPDALEWLLPHARAGCVTGPQIRDAAAREMPVVAVSNIDWKNGLIRHQPVPDGQPASAGMVSGCCLMAPASLWRQVGLLDEKFFLYYEDTDFVARALAAGACAMYEPRAVIFHHEGAATGSTQMSPLALYYNTRNRLYFMSKHRPSSARFLAYFVVTRIAYALRYATSRQWSRLSAMMQGLTDYLGGRMGHTSRTW